MNVLEVSKKISKISFNKILEKFSGKTPVEIPGGISEELLGKL